jgi:predicted DNA-binding transcriptional regulator AlpA
MSTATKKKPRPIVPIEVPVDCEACLSIGKIAALLSLSRRVVERKIAAGEFPEPDLKEGRMPRWHKQTYNDWYRRTYRKGK